MVELEGDPPEVGLSERGLRGQVRPRDAVVAVAQLPVEVKRVWGLASRFVLNVTPQPGAPSTKATALGCVMGLLIG